MLNGRRADERVVNSATGDPQRMKLAEKCGRWFCAEEPVVRKTGGEQASNWRPGCGASGAVAA